MKHKHSVNVGNSIDLYTDKIAAYEESSMFLDALRANIAYFAENISHDHNKDHRILHADDAVLKYAKQSNGYKVVVDAALAEGDQKPAYLASYDHDNDLPIDYAQQLVAYQGQVLVNKVDQGNNLDAYAIFKNIDPESVLFGGVVIVGRIFERRLYFVNGQAGMNNFIYNREALNTYPKYHQIKPAHVVSRSEIQQIQAYLPSSMEK